MESNPYNTQVELKFLFKQNQFFGFNNYQNTMYDFKLNTNLTQNSLNYHYVTCVMFANVQKLQFSI